MTRLASWGILTRDTGSCPISDPDKGSPISFRGCPVLENLLAGHPYLDLFKCRSISHLLEKAWNILGEILGGPEIHWVTFPQDGHLCVPLWIWRWCCKLPGCLNSFPHSSQEYLPPPLLLFRALLTQSEKTTENEKNAPKFYPWFYLTSPGPRWLVVVCPPQCFWSGSVAHHFLKNNFLNNTFFPAMSSSRSDIVTHCVYSLFWLLSKSFNGVSKSLKGVDKKFQGWFCPVSSVLQSKGHCFNWHQ